MAFSKNYFQLIMTAVLIVCILYIYTSVGFSFFPQDYWPELLIQENACTSMVQCFLYILTWGTRAPGSIGDQMRRPSFASKTHYFVRLVYDLSMFFGINLIMLNLFFGIIIDKFSEMRQEKKNIDKDMKNVCTVCSLERSLVRFVSSVVWWRN